MISLPLLKTWCVSGSNLIILRLGYSRFGQNAVKHHKKGRGSGGGIFHYKNKQKHDMHLA